MLRPMSHLRGKRRQQRTSCPEWVEPALALQAKLELRRVNYEGGAFPLEGAVSFICIHAPVSPFPSNSYNMDLCVPPAI